MSNQIESFQGQVNIKELLLSFIHILNDFSCLKTIKCKAAVAYGPKQPLVKR